MKKFDWLRMLFVFAAISVVHAGHAVSATESEQQKGVVISNGKALVTENCVSCHAITADDHSQHDEAPPFREIASRYSVWLLAESLAEGIVSGHPDMPEFVFEPDQIHAILSYMDMLKDDKSSTP